MALTVTVVTTITTTVNMDTMEPEHEVSIVSDDPIPQEFARLVAIGACRSTLGGLEGQVGDLPSEQGEQGEQGEEGN